MAAQRQRKNEIDTLLPNDFGEPVYPDTFNAPELTHNKVALFKSWHGFACIYHVVAVVVAGGLTLILMALMTLTDVFNNQPFQFISDTVKESPPGVIVRDRAQILSVDLSWVNSLATALLTLYHAYVVFQTNRRVTDPGQAYVTAYADSMLQRFDYARLFFQAFTYPCTAVLAAQLTYITEYKMIVLIASAVFFSQIFLWNIGAFGSNTKALGIKRFINLLASFLLFGAAMVPVMIEVGLIVFITKLESYPATYPLVIVVGFPTLVLVQYLSEMTALFNKTLYIIHNMISTIMFDVIVIGSVGFILFFGTDYITLEVV